MNFASDNVTGVAPEIMAALARVNEMPAAMPYGADPVTERMAARFNEVFETEVSVFPVATGTAANAISLAAISPPWGAIYCLAGSHANGDECGAPEFFTAGAKLIPVDGAAGRMLPAALEKVLVSGRAARGVHVVQPAGVTITQASETGTIYCPAAISDIAEVARSHGLKLHVDGARFANAVAAGQATPADLTWRAGVDILSFGATKNGAMAAEAVIVFDRGLAETIGFRRKRGAHLFSKMRFLSAQLDAYLTDDLWLRNARHANAQARRLSASLVAQPEIDLLYPTEANEVFASAPRAVWERLQAAGASFYTWPDPDTKGRHAARFVTAFNTRDDDLAALEAAL